eukprot:6606461-Pyramimonas_sp.AAC.1
MGSCRQAGVNGGIRMSSCRLYGGEPTARHFRNKSVRNWKAQPMCSRCEIRPRQMKYLSTMRGPLRRRGRFVSVGPRTTGVVPPRCVST